MINATDEDKRIEAIKRNKKAFYGWWVVRDGVHRYEYGTDGANRTDAHIASICANRTTKTIQPNVGHLYSDDNTRLWEAVCDCPECADRVARSLIPACHVDPWGWTSGGNPGDSDHVGTASCGVCGTILAREYRYDTRD